jgi:hypothetical protein
MSGGSQLGAPPVPVPLPVPNPLLAETVPPPEAALELEVVSPSSDAEHATQTNAQESETARRRVQKKEVIERRA